MMKSISDCGQIGSERNEYGWREMNDVFHWRNLFVYPLFNFATDAVSIATKWRNSDCDDGYNLENKPKNDRASVYTCGVIAMSP